MAAQPVKTSVQDLIYGLEVGVGVHLVRVLLYVLFVAFVMVLYTAKQFTAFSEQEAMEMAQLARNLAQTGSFTTQVVRPATMRFLIENKARTVEQDGVPRTIGGSPRIERHPDILHPPLYPAVTAGWFRLLGAPFDGPEGGKYLPELLIVGLGGVFTLGTGVFVLLLGRLLFDLRLGILAMTLFFLSNSVLGMSISGLSLPLAAFLAAAGWYFGLLAPAWRDQGRPPAVWLIPYLLASVLCVLLVLTRYGAIVIVPGLALYFAWSFPGRRLAASLALVLIVAAGVMPWAARTLTVSGRPWGYALETLLHETRHFPGDSLERTLAPDPEDLQPAAILRAVSGKWVRNVSRFYDQHLRTIGEGILGAFFLATFFYRFLRARVHRFRWCVLLSMALLAAAAGFYGNDTIRLLYLFWPVVLLYGLAFFFLLLERLDFAFEIQKIGVTAVVVGLSALPLLVTLIKPTPPFPYPPYFRPATARVCSLLQPDQLICTDMPWATAWYGNRNSLLLPATIDEFYRINDFVRDIDALYLTTLTRDLPWHSSLVTGAERTWYPIHNLNIPADFPLRQGVHLLNGDQLFITSQEVLSRLRGAQEGP